MRREKFRTGIYRLSNPLKGDFQGVEFPSGSKVFAMTKTFNGVPFTLIEGVIGGRVEQDLLRDPVQILMIVMSYIPCNIDFSNENIRLKELLKED